jgi:hypothetical protein
MGRLAIQKRRSSLTSQGSLLERGIYRPVIEQK